ncbi:MAG: ABC transporter ATP-binding protein [Betaproteobacteria bacterium]|jgi:peptide/nickel transport system ATP-binding protein|nr:ABC transporter ATP-binding protein [Betaproteobacteria bacterium]NBS47096.1 ABC transporter ATP-binding protein [Betaproteobacteria bacterium]
MHDFATDPGAASGAPPLLAVRNLRVQLPTAQGPAEAVRGLDFALARGETLGLIGESGCGKSLSALALMGLLPEGARVSGSVQLEGRELTTLPERDLCALRGNRMAMIFQEPMSALNPVHTVGRQVAEPLRLHRGLSAAQAREAAAALLDRVGIAQASRRLDAWPHQFSGGQRQRIMIAMALACEPDLLIADEPTTALDVTVQRQILDLIDSLVRERGMALILISHDLAVMAQRVQRMIVMYGGSMVESAPSRELFDAPRHPYTRGLLAARPVLGPAVGAGSGHARGQRLATIAGTVPELSALPPGCGFAGRCAFTAEACASQRPPAVDIGVRHRVWCAQPPAYEDHGDRT